MLEMTGVSKVFERRTGTQLTVLNNVDLTVERGQFVTVIGPSGCGKTTLLNCVAGLEQPTSGSIMIDGDPVKGPGPDRAMVFQQSLLLPWRSVEGNVAYGLQLRRSLSKAEIKDRVEAALELVGLSGFGGHYPHEVSGGMQQRANLARALAVEPKLVLMDEPFGALDALTKEKLQEEMSSLVSSIGTTVMFITHDITEAIFLADRIVVMTGDAKGVAAEFEVPFSRPRSREVTEDPSFKALARKLHALLAPPKSSAVPLPETEPEPTY